jgi:hypothetical protein
VLLQCWGMATHGWGAILSMFPCPAPWSQLEQSIPDFHEDIFGDSS